MTVFSAHEHCDHIPPLCGSLCWGSRLVQLPDHLLLHSNHSALPCRASQRRQPACRHDQDNRPRQRELREYTQLYTRQLSATHTHTFLPPSTPPSPHPALCIGQQVHPHHRQPARHGRQHRPRRGQEGGHERSMAGRVRHPDQAPHREAGRRAGRDLPQGLGGRRLAAATLARHARDAPPPCMAEHQDPSRRGRT